MNLSIILDILILAIIAFFIVLSSKQGFVKTFISFVGCIAALVLSIVLSWVVSDLIYGSFVRPSLVLSVEEYLDSKTFASVAEMPSPSQSIFIVTIPGFLLFPYTLLT